MTIYGTTAESFFNHGTFGENIVIAQETHTLSATLHADKAPLCTMQTVSGALRTGDTTSVLKGVTINWTDSAATPTGCSLKLLIFNKTGVPSTVTVGTALAPTQSDADYLIGVVDIPSSGFYTLNEIKTTKVDCDINLFNNDTSKGSIIYYTLINASGAGFTPTTNEKITVQLKIKQN